MAYNTFPELFIRIEPFRQLLLRMLRPWDIANLLDATGYGLTQWETARHMDILDDIIADTVDLTHIQRLGMSIRFFGHDLDIMTERLRNPRKFWNDFGPGYVFHIFVVVSGRDQDLSPVLIEDFRSQDDRDLVPNDMTETELQNAFESDVSASVKTLSKWILCAPYLSGTLPSSIPGWVPVFNSQDDVSIRAYFSTFNGCYSPVLYMGKGLISSAIGFRTLNDVLHNMASLSIPVITMNKGNRMLNRSKVHLVHSVLPLYGRMSRPDFVVANVIHPLNASLTIEL